MGKVLMKFPWLYDLVSAFRGLSRRDLLCRRMKVRNSGRYLKLSKHIKGKGNLLEIGSGSMIHGLKIHVVGNNNRLILGSNCSVGPHCSFWIEGNNCTIRIGAGTTFTHTVHLCAQEEGMSILVGEDCMFANRITVRTSDSHPIYDLKSGLRINPPRSVEIGRHVWIAPGAKIFKGASVGANSIIGSDAVVTGVIPENSLAVGAPCRVVKQEVSWSREGLY